MKQSLSKYLLRAIKSIVLNTRCFLLWLKNLFLLRMSSQVEWVALYDRIVIEGNEVELLWKVRGCHKIKITGIGTVKGNIHGIKFKVLDISKHIEVYFYGIRSTEHKTVSFIGDRIKLLNKFYSESKMPVTNADLHIREKLSCQFTNSALTSNFEKIYFEIDSFEQHTYEPLNTTQQ